MPDLIKPFRLSCIQNMQTIGGKTYLYATAYFGFSLLDPDSLLTEANYLEVSTGCLPAGGFLEMGYPKEMPEVLIAGEAQAPAGTSVKAREVSVVVGSMTKRAVVFGDRYWTKENDVVQLTDAMPFEAMPLMPQLAFGNEKHPLNPVGRGCDPDYVLDRFGYAALANIENPAKLVKHPRDRPEPVLFGPLGHEHPLRKSKLGTPDHEWIRTSFPEPPPGFQWSYFNVAPADQRLAKPLNGDEPVKVTGMSAEHPAIDSRLPGLRVRIFAVHDRQAARMTEIAAKLETVWIFGTAEIGGLYYRGSIKVADKSASDVVALIVAAERLSDEPRAGEYYAEVYRLRTDLQEGVLHTLNDTQLMPPLSEAEVAAIEARSSAYSEELAQKLEKRIAWETEQVMKESGMPDMMLPAMQVPTVPRFPLPAPEDLVAGKVDLARVIANVRSVASSLQAKGDAAMQAEFARQAAAGVPIPPDMGPALTAAVKSGDPATKALFEQASKGSGVADKVPGHARALVKAAQEKKSGPSLEELIPGSEAAMFARIDEIIAKLPGGGTAADEEELFRIARARALALPEADPFYEMKMRLSEAGEEAKAMAATATKGERVSPDDALGKPEYADRKPTDFRAVDAELKALPPEARADIDRIDSLLADLLPKSAGHDLPPTLALARAAESTPKHKPDVTSVDEILKRIDAAAAGMDEASFFADLDEQERAFLAGEDHERSQIPEPVYPMEEYTPGVARRLGDLVLEYIARGESFARRDIAGADFSHADLSDLDLAGAFLERAKLTGATLKRSNFVGGALTGADLTEADASGSDFSRANISRIVAPRARFDDTSFSTRLVLSPMLEGASFRNAHFDQMTFIDGVMKSADFEGAVFTNCFFLNCDLAGTAFRNARFEKTMFAECTGAGSDWSGAHFDRTLMARLKAPESRWSGAAFDKSTFVGNAELPRSFFDGIKGQFASFLEANLDECCFLRAEIPECLFLKCTMVSGDFRAISARRAAFNESVLTHSDFFAGDLMEAQLGLCDARRASFRGANLFSANLTDMKLAAADLSYANLGQTVLELPT